MPRQNNQQPQAPQQPALNPNNPADHPAILVAMGEQLDELKNRPTPIHKIVLVSLIVFGLALIGSLFLSLAVYRSMPDTAEITAEVLSKVPTPTDYGPQFENLEARVAKVTEAQAEAQKNGNPELVKKLSDKLDAQVAKSDKDQVETADRLKKVEDGNKTMEETIKSEMGKIRDDLAEARRPVSVTPPTPPPAPAEADETPPGALRVVFEQYDPNKHKQSQPYKETGVKTFSTEKEPIFQVDEKVSNPRTKQGIAEGINFVLAPDGRPLISDTTPKISKGEPYQLEVETASGWVKVWAAKL